MPPADRTATHGTRPAQLARGADTELKSFFGDTDPGLGKSLLTLDLCARLSTGRPFADEAAAPEPAAALVLNGEDGAEDTIRPRLLALEADVKRVFVRPGCLMKP